MRSPVFIRTSLLLLLFLLKPGLKGLGQSYIPERGHPMMAVGNAVPIKAYAFDLSEVKLLNSPFRHAMDMDSAYLLLLKPDRLLYRFYTHAGLPPKDSVYGGWESEGLSGHTLGHYLSACAMMYQSTGNPEFKSRVGYIVQELARCQRARGSGYVGAIPGEDSIFAQVSRGQIHSGGFDLNGGWSPWYTVHKLMAGLCDAYLYCHNKEALKVVTGMADWAYGVVNHLSDSLRLLMLHCEYGGMNDVLANLYGITGQRKYLELSRKFHDDFVLGPLARQVDPLPGKHSNTNVPKAIGCARRYELTGNRQDSTIAAFFWQTMVKHHSYVIGGNSNYEYCGPPDSLSDRLSDNTCETCNTYNMLKLTRHLFAWQPSSSLMDYYERALYNHILASQNPQSGMMCYFVPLRMGTRKEFSDSFNTFTCCVGSGLENHSKYAEQIYSQGSLGDLYVNLFIPSVLHWKERNIKLTQTTEFPSSGQTELSWETGKPVNLPVRVRIPFWTHARYQFKLIASDGRETLLHPVLMPDGYALIKRTWHNGDRLQCDFPMDLYAEPMPDNPGRIAIKYGPLVLAGELGSKRPDPVYGTPVLLTNDRNPANLIKKMPGAPLRFKTKDAGKPFDVELAPFYEVHNQYYSVYWDYFSPQDWKNREEEYEAEKKREEEIASASIDYFRIGEMQPERDHQLEASAQSYVSDALGVMGREARPGNYFAFDMGVEPADSNFLLFTFIGDDHNRALRCSIDGKPWKELTWNGGKTGKFYQVLLPVPLEFTRNRNQVRIWISADQGKTAGRIFGVRTLRKRILVN